MKRPEHKENPVICAGTYAGTAGTPVSALQYLQSIYRDPMEHTSTRIRAAVECLPFENPKLSAVGFGVLDGQAFAERLERALTRSERARLIEGTCVGDERS